MADKKAPAKKTPVKKAVVKEVEEIKEEIIETTEVEKVEEVEEVVETPEVVEEKPPHVDVKPDKPAPKKKAKGKVSAFVVNCNSVRLRTGANLKTSTLAIMPVGTKVIVNLENETESFHEVTYGNGSNQLIGYTIKKFLELEG